MNQIHLEELDWIMVTDPIEQISMEMEVIDYIEMEAAYILAAPAYEEPEEEEEVEEEEDAAYIFKICEKEEAEFFVTEENAELSFGVTTDMTDEEFKNIAEIFASSENYDLEVDENADTNE